MNNQDIEKMAQQVLKEIYEAYKHKIQDPWKMIDPRLGCYVKGVTVEKHDSLGIFGLGTDRFEVAGAIDRRKRQILISNSFSLEEQRFTLAHELGHWMLHTDEILHRDRPVKGLTKDAYLRPKKEKEADYFAACFLMPRNPLIAAFKYRFGEKLPFKFDEHTSFCLAPDDPDMLVYAERKSMERELALATCEIYGARQFPSLAKFFKVSPSSMAIRLFELELIKWP